MAHDPADSVDAALAASPIIAALARPDAVAGDSRPLQASEVDALERAGNRADDWARVRVSRDFDPARVHDCRFGGDVLLGCFRSTHRLHETDAPSGVYGSTLIDCVVEDDALVRSVRLASRALIGRGALVIDVGELVGGQPSAFGIGASIRLGNETGGRELAIYPEMDLITLDRMALDRGDAAARGAYEAAVAAYADAARSRWTVVDARASVRHAGAVRSSFIGEAADVDGAARIERSVIMSNSDEKTFIGTAVILHESIVQWRARVTDGAALEHSVVLEGATVGVRASVASSVIGPSCVLEKGEVVASLLGPLIAMHHQSLLIATIWLGGRGNVPAGALIGSNHTGRLPDQEAFPGEGVFFGLGVRVKLPLDMREAPYSLVAVGALPPQRIEFPFSLLRDGDGSFELHNGNGRAIIHELLPGWVLSESPYTVARAKIKHLKRYASRRNPLDLDPLRPEMLRKCMLAREALLRAPAKEVLTSEDLPGLGACYLTDRARADGVAAYGFALLLRALEGLWDEVRRSEDIESALGREGDGAWAMHRAILLEHRPGRPLEALLEEFLRMSETHLDAVRAAKAKDDARGRKVQPDYDDSHVSADEDSLVAELAEGLARTRSEIEEFIRRIGVGAPTISGG